MNKIYTIIIAALINVQILFAQFINVQVNDPASTNPNEVTIAINPVNPNILAAGANISYFYNSTDGGVTWSQTNLTSTLGVWGDPCVVFDGTGNLYFGHLSNPLNGYWIDRIVVQKSTDNGATWSDGAGIGLTIPRNQDKEWLAVDMTGSQYNNNIYMSWTEFDDYGSTLPTDSSRILFSRSTDQGVTWSNPQRISDVGGDCVDDDLTVEGAVPAVGPNGEVYISWAGPLGLMFDKSSDGGLTFGHDIFISDFPGGWAYDIPGINRCNGLPITACDISNSSYNGNIYVNWTDQRNGPDDTDVFISKSTDGGDTWSNIIKVNNDNSSRHQFFSWMTVDQSTGYVYVVFYDRRNTTGAATDVFVAYSLDGGDTFTNVKVSNSPFTPSANIFFGDYTNISAMNGKIYPIWTRLENGVRSVYTALMDDSIVPVELSSFSAVKKGNSVVLNWTTDTEINNQGFEIERKSSKFSDNWNAVGFVNGNGTTPSPNDYSFIDDISSLQNSDLAYRLKQINFDGSFKYSYEVFIKSAAPLTFALNQNYPNPFNPATTIGYRLPQSRFVSLRIYDSLGNEIEELVNSVKPAGSHEVNFDGSKFSSGVYYYRLMAGEYNSIKKMILVK